MAETQLSAFMVQSQLTLFKILKFPVAQSAGAVEYTDCFSAEG